MGMGIGVFLPTSAIIKRRYRWTFELGPDAVMGGAMQPIQPLMVTIAARPNLTFDETELNFMNETDYIPAKPKWDPINITILDFAKVGGNGADTALLQWLQRTYIYGDPSVSGEMSDPVGYGRRTGVLKMWNGVSQVVEQWTMYHCWPQTSNWGDLDYSGTENATIEVTVRFLNAKCELFAVGGGAGKTSANTQASIS